ncbi:NADPH-dependent FMN reductase [Bdellovibrio sp. HCB337]|uniref:NADPH-dependent FMN reductase n=1 Tax=Bdellovibrio sp. HCB337 TaxID=3394358 RepID=UPI0039A64FA7
MKYIISGTDRADSNSLKISRYIQSLYKESGEDVGLIDMRDIRGELSQGPHYGKDQPASLQAEIDKVVKSDGLIVVCPEYNGSMPGILKYYIDHMKFPDSFEYRPVCFVGLGGMFGGMRPVEHLQQVFGYRNAFIYPQRVFLMNVHKVVKDGALVDPLMQDLLKSQVKGFQAFCKALKSAGLDANSFIAQKATK